MHQFLVSSLVEDTLALDPKELSHATKSLRLGDGDQLRLTDGEGNLAIAELRGESVLITRRWSQPRVKPEIHVVQALAKGDRDELAVQTSTELGASSFTPWQAKRSVVRWDSKKAVKGSARWQQIAAEAMKQSHQAWLPKIQDFTSNCEFEFYGQLIVLDPEAQKSLAEIDLSPEITLVIGPEGGISESETERLVQRGAVTASLGSAVLRTSTAAPAAISTIRTKLGWG